MAVSDRCPFIAPAGPGTMSTFFTCIAAGFAQQAGSSSSVSPLPSSSAQLPQTSVGATVVVVEAVTVVVVAPVTVVVVELVIVVVVAVMVVVVTLIVDVVVAVVVVVVPGTVVVVVVVVVVTEVVVLVVTEIVVVEVVVVAEMMVVVVVVVVVVEVVVVVVPPTSVSTAPMSHAAPCGRVTPRSSASGGGQPAAASIAGLPASSARVSRKLGAGGLC